MNEYEQWAASTLGCSEVEYCRNTGKLHNAYGKLVGWVISAEVANKRCHYLVACNFVVKGTVPDTFMQYL